MYSFSKMLCVFYLKPLPNESVLTLPVSAFPPTSPSSIPSWPLLCFLMICIFVNFLSAVTKCLTRNNLIEEGFIRGLWPSLLRSTVSGAAGDGLHCTHSEEAECDGGWCSACSLLLVQPLTPAPRVMPPTLGWVFPLHAPQPGKSHTDVPRDLSYESCSLFRQVDRQY